jgi:hypothetical protein
MDCDQIVDFKCSKGHVQKRKCSEIRPPTCQKCDLEDKRDRKILEMDMDLQDKRLRDQVKHDLEVADLELQIRKIREDEEDKKTAFERARALEQKKRDLEATKRQAAESSQQAPPKPSQTTPSSNDDNDKGPRQPDAQGHKPTAIPKLNTPKLNTPKLNTPKLNTPKLNTPELTTPKKSDSELEWERQKKVEGASNAAIDDLMGLTGLEEVKEKFLDIKAKIETVARQGIDMKKERMGMVMLGNPGTGMLH